MDHPGRPQPSAFPDPDGLAQYDMYVSDRRVVEAGTKGGRQAAAASAP